MDKGQAIPVILKKKVEETGPLQVNIGKDTIHRQYNREEHVSLDRIFEDSESKFYMAGKNTKIGLLNFLQLFDKHDTNEILDLEKEDIVISSELITRIATAPVVDEDQEDMKYIDAVAIGIFCSSLFLFIPTCLPAGRACRGIARLFSLKCLGKGFLHFSRNEKIRQ